MSNLVEYAKRELQLAGAFEKDSMYEGMLGNSVLELVETFAKQGHSGMSAQITLQLFIMVANFKPLTDITDNPDDWMDVSEHSVPKGEKMYQCRRRSDAFSRDGGKTYYLLDNPKEFLTSKKHNV